MGVNPLRFTGDHAKGQAKDRGLCHEDAWRHDRTGIDAAMRRSLSYRYFPSKENRISPVTSLIRPRLEYSMWYPFFSHATGDHQKPMVRDAADFVLAFLSSCRVSYKAQFPCGRSALQLFHPTSSPNSLNSFTRTFIMSQPSQYSPPQPSQDSPANGRTHRHTISDASISSMESHGNACSE